MDLEPIKAASQAGRWEELLTLVAAASPSGPGDEALLAAFRSRALRFQGRGDAAEAEARRAVELAPAGPVELDALTELIFAMRGRKHALLQRAIALADRLDDSRRGAVLRIELARDEMMRGDLRLAARVLEEARVVHPEIEARSSYLLLKARIAYRLGQDDRVWLERAVAVAEGPLVRARVLGDLGLHHHLRGDRDRAIELLRLALEEVGQVEGRPHTEAQILVLLGECLRESGDLDGAETCYLRGAELLAERKSPDEPICRCNLALLQLQRGDVAGARAILEDVEQHASQLLLLHAVVALGLGACAAETGDRALWKRAYATFEAGVPEGTPLDRDFLDLAERAGVAAPRAGWVDEAVQALRVAVHMARGLGDEARLRAQERRLRRLADNGAQAPLGPFFLVRPLSAGSFGEVWLARHHTGAEVAIKLLAGDLDRARLQLDNELRHVAALDHPNIVRLLDHGTVDRTAAVMRPGLVEGSRWLAVELAPDGTLSARLGRLPFSEVRRVLLSLLDALAHAHARGVLHLDIKPSNVLAAGERVLLADFGLATRPGPEGYVPSGTPQYMAPEQFAHEGRNLGPWTDLYGVGCLAVALVSGTPPFGTRGSTVETLRAAHRSKQPEFAPVIELPRGFLAWVQRMLAKDPQHRFRHAADAARSLLSLDWVQEVGPTGAIRPPEAFSTVVLPAMDELGPVPAAPPEGAIEVPPPLVPLRWQRAEAFDRGGLADAGIRLLALRRPVLVGRDHERSLLWGAMRACHEEQRPRAVLLEGPEGVGRTALGQWLVERAGELGVRVPILWLDDTDVSGAGARLDGDEPVLVVASSSGEDHALLEHDRTVPIPLGPLPEADVREMLASLLAVCPDLATAIVARADGMPAYVRHVLADLVLVRGLVRTDDGWALRHEVELPDTLEALWRRRLGSVLAGIPPAQRQVADPRVQARLLDAGFADLRDERLVLEPWVARFLSP